MSWLRLLRILTFLTAALGIVLLSYLGGEWIHNRQVHATLAAFPAIQPSDRILVVSPHADDETLGPGGLIETAISAGAQVHVVLITNGDGFTRAVRAAFHEPLPDPQDYVRFAYQRQQETLRALSILGLPSRDVTFLGYPDGGTARMWYDHWDRNDPYLSPHTRDEYSPYNNSFTPRTPYAGAALVSDLENIITQFNPTMVVVPHPGDRHPDHMMAYAFTVYALADLGREDVPLETYLVHRGNWDWPTPQGLHMDAYLVPPWDLWSIEKTWQSLELTPAQEELKLRAVDAYRTQMAVIRGFLLSFVRRNELFVPRPPVEFSDEPLVPSAGGTGFTGQLVQADSAKDTIGEDLRGAGDLIGVYMGRDGANLQFGVETRENASRSMAYELQLRAFDGQGHVTRVDLRLVGKSAGFLSLAANSANVGPVSVQYTGHDVLVSIPAARLGAFHDIFISWAASYHGLVIDRTEWVLVRVGKENPTPSTAKRK